MFTSERVSLVKVTLDQNLLAKSFFWEWLILSFKSPDCKSLDQSRHRELYSSPTLEREELSVSSSLLTGSRYQSFRQFSQSLHLNPAPLIHSRSLYSRKSSTVRDQPKLNEPEVPLRWIAGYLNQRFEEDSPQSYRNMTIISTLRLWERHTPLVEVNQAVSSLVD